MSSFDWKRQSEEFWKARLTVAQFQVLRRRGTERPFSGEYCQSHGPGRYACAGCGQELFQAQQKFDSGTGWPSFTEAISADAVETEVDLSHGMIRTEVHCSRCGGHLGHVFEDGPPPTGLRFCINSLALKRIEG